MADKKRGLGRGLDEIMGAGEWLKREDIRLFYCPIDRIVPNPLQPRQQIYDAQLEELVLSVQQKGVLQPIMVNRTDVPDQYQIIAGERRWQAAKLAGLTEVPVLLRETTPTEVLELALIENIQRRDLNCIEEAVAYRRLQEEFQLTQEEIARRVGKNRSTIANLLRLLQLPEEIQEDILNNRLTMGHARALLGLGDHEEQKKIRDLVIRDELSVRQTEQRISQKNSSQSAAGNPRPTTAPHWKPLQDILQDHFKSRVLIRGRGEKGTVTISFSSEEELQHLIERFGLAVSKP